MARRNSPRGLTFIELLVALVVFAVLAAVAVPSMMEFIARKRVEGAVDELLVDLRQARAVQAANNINVDVQFKSNADMTCYSIAENNIFASCDCTRTSTPVCSSMLGVPRLFKTVRHPVSRKVSVAPAPDSPSALSLQKPAGLPLDGTSLQIIVSAPQGGSVRVTTNAAGVAQACSIAGHQNAYKAC